MITPYLIKSLYGSKVYNRGLDYYNRGYVRNLSFNERTNSYNAFVHGTSMYKVKVKTDDSSIAFEDCTCPAFRDFGQCKHVVAVLMKIAKQIEAPKEALVNQEHSIQSNNLDFTSRFLNQLSSSSISSPNHQQAKESLKAKFILKFDYQLFKGKIFTVEMQVGPERTYVVKDLKKFVESVLHVSEHYFTPNFSYDPSHYKFSPEDQRVMNLLIEMYRSENFYKEHSYYSKSERGMSISPYFAPDLLDALKEVDCHFEEDRYTYSEIFIEKDQLPFAFSMDQSEGGYEFEFESATAYNHFPEYRLLQSENLFYLLKPEQNNFVAELMKIIQQSEDDKIVLDTDQMDTFASTVLPSLEKVGEVTLSEQVQANLVNPALNATLHLEREDEKLTAKLAYHYGSVTIDPMQEQVTKTDSQQILVRDMEKETSIMQWIEFASFKFNGTHLYLNDENDIFIFLYEVLPQMEEHLDVYLTHEVKSMLMEQIQSPRLDVNLDSSENFLEVQFDLGDIDQSEISKLLQSVKEKKRYYRLPNGAFVSLEDEALHEMNHFVQEMNINPNDLAEGPISLPAFRGLQMDEFMSQQLKKNYNEAFEKLIQDIRNPEVFETSIPENLHADLRQYQNVGFQWLKSLSRYRFGGILADDMGLGKTLQSIAFLLSEKQSKAESMQPALVVSPASLVYNWQAEFERFAPSMNIRVIHGTITEREHLFENLDDVDVVITSYPLVRRDVESYKELTFSTLILDEAQAIKNHLTKQARAIRAIRAGNRFALSGTPIENSLEELWALFDVILPGFFPPKKEFKNLPEEKIARMSRPFILRRVKQDVLTELPDKIESVNHSELTKEQKQLYLGYLEKIQGEAASAISEEGFQKSRMKILAGLTRLRQLCCHPSLFIDEYEGESGKLNQLLDMIETARENGHRILIFSQFSSMLKIIYDNLSKIGENVFYLDGQTPSKERVELVNRFNEGEKDIFLISMKAGGTGLNLTGADTVILYDLWWNPAVEEQAAGRAHRMGQKNVVQVYRLITKGTIEEKIHALQQRKRELIENVIQPGETNFQSLNENDIRELLNV
ncbi:DEAD/DEAH box helicase [Halalkalibacillus halophilus]|uniref:DEAD/DEAH box helicase n=1 Tax=Halalkalibacillus halophilus TaxID=392827 RepID=UPI0006879919|nr:DEAD/DEAH box helicase [Halalkalibacillus halophilus]